MVTDDLKLFFWMMLPTHLLHQQRLTQVDLRPDGWGSDAFQRCRPCAGTCFWSWFPTWFLFFQTWLVRTFICYLDPGNKKKKANINITLNGNHDTGHHDTSTRVQGFFNVEQHFLSFIADLGHIYSKMLTQGDGVFIRYFNIKLLNKLVSFRKC